MNNENRKIVLADDITLAEVVAASKSNELESSKFKADAVGFLNLKNIIDVVGAEIIENEAAALVDEVQPQPQSQLTLTADELEMIQQYRSGTLSTGIDAVASEVLMINSLEKPVVSYLAKAIEDATEFLPSAIYEVAKEYGEAVMCMRESMTSSEITAKSMMVMIPDMIHVMSSDNPSDEERDHVNAIVDQMEMVRNLYIANQVRELQQKAESEPTPTPGETEQAREVNSTETSNTTGRTRVRNRSPK